MFKIVFKILLITCCKMNFLGGINQNFELKNINLNEDLLQFYLYKWNILLVCSFEILF